MRMAIAGSEIESGKDQIKSAVQSTSQAGKTEKLRDDEVLPVDSMPWCLVTGSVMPGPPSHDSRLQVVKIRTAHKIIATRAA